MKQGYIPWSFFLFQPTIIAISSKLESWFPLEPIRIFFFNFLSLQHHRSQITVIIKDLAIFLDLILKYIVGIRILLSCFGVPMKWIRRRLLCLNDF